MHFLRRFRKKTVEQADSGDFFERDGLLFEPLAEVNKTIGGLKTAQPLISGLAGDPTLRGIMRTLSFAAQGVEVGELKLDQLHWPLSLAEKTLNNVLAGKAATFSWQELVQGRPLQAAQLRHFVEIDPILNFSALQPGAEATAAIRQAAVDLNLMGDYGAKVDLTGRVPLNDDQFSVLQQSTVRDTLTALIGVLIVLWLALRSWKIIASVFLSLIVGLTVTTALGLVMVGAFNLISIAFFVLFVGLGVDFGIQFSVRYRSERHERNDLHAALRSAARKIATPLALAAAATAVAFFSFLRTNSALAPSRRPSASADGDTVAAIRATAANLSKAADNATGVAADSARHVSDLLTRLAQSDAATRARAEAAFVPPLVDDLNQLRKSLDPKEITVNTLPANLVRDWLTPDGRARVQVLPKGDLKDTNVLRNFATAILAAEPSATGPAISNFESGKTVTGAFINAGLLALVSIAVLLLIALRRITDVLLTLVPLLLAGAVTLELCVLTGLALNFANIIALPLLLGVGVAFKIYYIMAWRAGQTGLLQSALTRAIIFSAMTSGIAFGSMWASSYRGMSSMGKLMALALLCTMAAAVLFQPVLMGRPRQLRTASSQSRQMPAAAE